jgi:hypothetical protein
MNVVMLGATESIGAGAGILPSPFGRAAEYVRMSTEHQKYSTENQGETIHQYATRRGLVIVAAASVGNVRGGFRGPTKLAALRSFMPEANQTQKTPITFGPCPKCRTSMLLGLIELDEPGHEKRTYRCDSCGHSVTKAVKYR